MIDKEFLDSRDYSENLHFGDNHNRSYIKRGGGDINDLLNRIVDLESRVAILETKVGNFPTLVSRGDGRAPLLQIGIGGYVHIRCSSHFKELFDPDKNTVDIGDTFTITEEEAMKGAAYVPVNVDGYYAESGPLGKTKAFIGAGTYFVICGALFTQSNDSIITVIRIA